MFRNKRIFIFGGVFVSLCMLFLVHDVKSSDKNKEKYFISIEKQSDDNGVKMTIKKGEKKEVVTTCQLEKKNSLTNDKFKNVYSLQDNDIAEILSNSECEFLDEKNKKVEDKSILAIGTLERIHNPILRFLLSCIFKDKQYVIYCDDANSKNANGLFQKSKATKIKILSCGNNVTDISYMFSGCRSLTNLDVSNFTTDNVTNMSDMFNNCSSLTVLDLSNFNTDNVTNMSEMFNWCSSLTELNLSKFNTTNVTNMSNMFSFCSSLTELDLSKFNTINVTGMNGMFYKCSKLTKLNLSDFTTDKVTDMSLMFWGCSSLKTLDLSKFNYYCTNLTELDLSKFNTTNVINMSYMFYNCSSLTVLDLSKFNTDKVKNMSNMFYDCSKLTKLNLSNFNTSNVIDMQFMFDKCFQNEATLICKASTLKNITDDTKISCLIILNEKKAEINGKLNNNPGKVYKCSVKRVWNDSQITALEEYQSRQ